MIIPLLFDFIIIDHWSLRICISSSVSGWLLLQLNLGKETGRVSKLGRRNCSPCKLVNSRSRYLKKEDTFTGNFMIDRAFRKELYLLLTSVYAKKGCRFFRIRLLHIFRFSPLWILETRTSVAIFKI